MPHNHPLTHTVPGGMDRVRAVRPLLNGRAVPPGVHHDVDHPVPVVATLRWEAGPEEIRTDAVAWWTTRAGTVVRVHVTDPRVMTGAVWVPLEDVRRLCDLGAGRALRATTSGHKCRSAHRSRATANSPNLRRLPGVPAGQAA